MTHAIVLEELGLTNEYAAWRLSSRTYRGKTKPKWTWEVAISIAKELETRRRFTTFVVPPEWLQFVDERVHLSGHTWEHYEMQLVHLRPVGFESPEVE